MINGAHIVISSVDPKADRIFFKNILKLPNVDVGEGWIIFGLPPAEIAIHPSSKNNVHEFYLMCENIEKFIHEMAKHNIRCSKVRDQGWGLLSQITLPGGGELGVYEPRHARPKPMMRKKAIRKK